MPNVIDSLGFQLPRWCHRRIAGARHDLRHERTDGSGRGLCNPLRKGSFAAGLLRSEPAFSALLVRDTDNHPSACRRKAYHARVLRRMQSHRMLTSAAADEAMADGESFVAAQMCRRGA